jgi:hypothetical protein
MVSKLIFANILAVIMMNFEQHAPAEVKERPQRASGNQTIPAESHALKVSTAKQETQAPDTTKAPAMAKKPMYKTNRTAKAPHPHLIQAKSPAIDCCFRGYRS